MNKIQSMINNLKNAAGDRFGAGRAVQYLGELKEMTGQSEQSLLVSMIIFAFTNNPNYASARDNILNGDVQRENAKQYLTKLRHLLGQTEQSLMSEMVHYAVENDPAYETFREKKNVLK